MRCVAFAILVAAGCGSTHKLADAAGPPDAAVIDAPGTYAAMPRADERREVVSGAARMSAGTLTMDVEVGHPVEQTRMSAGTLVVEGAAVIKP